MEEHVAEDISNETSFKPEVRKNENRMMPAFMSGLMRRQFLHEMVQNFPEPLQNRITVLKNIQLEHLKLEAEFFQEVYELEKKYQVKYQPFFDKRRDIVIGKVEPPAEVPKWKDDNGDFEKVENSGDFAQILKEYTQASEDTKGIPNFWLTIFRNTEILSEMIQDQDEPLLKKLSDITIKYDDEHSYTLEFHFEKNEYFSNAVLTKKYYLKSAVDENYPFSYEGPEIFKCKGCTINWEKKMNLTVKTIRKKQKHKERGAVRTIVKQVPIDSFFHFFNPPEVQEDKYDADDDKESRDILATDFEIGHFLRARVIPKAILYYTGDIIDDEDDDEDDFEGEDEDEGDNPNPETQKSGDKHQENSPNECKSQ